MKNGNALTNYNKEIIDRCLQLYNYEVDGRRVYRVDAIPAIIRQEFSAEPNIEKLSRGTIYFWLHRYDAINYRIRREKKENA